MTITLTDEIKKIALDAVFYGVGMTSRWNDRPS
jgi:hypothetical protein